MERGERLHIGTGEAVLKKRRYFLSLRQSLNPFQCPVPFLVPSLQLLPIALQMERRCSSFSFSFSAFRMRSDSSWIRFSSAARVLPSTIASFSNSFRIPRVSRCVVRILRRLSASEIVTLRASIWRFKEPSVTLLNIHLLDIPQGAVGSAPQSGPPFGQNGSGDFPPPHTGHLRYPLAVTSSKTGSESRWKRSVKAFRNIRTACLHRSSPHGRRPSHCSGGSRAEPDRVMAGVADIKCPAAVRTDQTSGERMVRPFPPPGSQPRRIALSDLLYPLKLLPADDRRMVIPYQVLRHLPIVYPTLVSQEIRGIGLLQKCVPAIPFQGDHSGDHCGGPPSLDSLLYGSSPPDLPFCFSLVWGRDVFVIQPPCDIGIPFPILNFLKDPPDNRRFLLHNLHTVDLISILLRFKCVLPFGITVSVMS